MSSRGFGSPRNSAGGKNRRRYGRRAGQAGGGYSRRAPMLRGVFTKAHHFKQMYRPSGSGSTSGMYLNTGSNASWDSTEGILLGPDSGATGDCHFRLFFTVAQLNQSSNFAGLFDCYRINKAVVQFIPVQNVMGNATLSTPTAQLTQELITVIDRDDGDLLATPGEYEEYETYKRTGAYEKHTRKLVPAVSMNVFKTSGTTIGYSQRYKQWIDWNSTDVEHYGIKGTIPSASTNTNNYRCGWYVRVKLYFSCKQVR